jgi:hypothetical protein
VVVGAAAAGVAEGAVVVCPAPLEQAAPRRMTPQMRLIARRGDCCEEAGINRASHAGIVNRCCGEERPRR